MHWHKVAVLCRGVGVLRVVGVVPAAASQQRHVLAGGALAPVGHKAALGLGSGRAVAGGQEGEGEEEPHDSH